ncbi:MAG TPA: TonB-dependent receptor [Acidobacteriaceae bacterium]|jgi:outer membrane receptor protein involved in Fe transport|nr:TonB-dependent receptor [Acidobacteriaceae bacterium]
MRFFHRIHLACALALLAAAAGFAQTSGMVRNAHGDPVPSAAITDMAGNRLAVSSADGSFTLSQSSGEVEVTAPHYVTAVVTITAAQPVNVVLRQPLETVTVTAYRSALGSSDSPASTRVLDEQQLQLSASPSLDGKLTQVPGFTLFRRSSSIVANPTTEGVSLRGLGSTAASRSLVVLDDIPLNDPYGGWIHWEELPELSIHSVEVVRGGASDLYGSSAIGGVISVIPVRPQASGIQLFTSGGSESTLDEGALANLQHGPWSGVASGGLIATDGYTLIAPDLRGPIDQPSNVHAQNGLAEVDRALPNGGRVFLRSNVLNELRHNGTPVTGNATRLWRGAAGADWRGFALRLFGDNEHYRQTFSSVGAGRASETLTRFAFDPADELGTALRWRRTLGAHALVLAGADTHDVRAEDSEQLFSGKGSTLDTTARQRQTGVWGEALLTPAQWTISGSARVDHFSNFDAQQFSSSAAPVQLPSFSETVFDPRLGLVRRITQSFSLNVSGFRAYRAPTENELYRTGQVGQQITEPNPNLRSERATGWEAGFQTDIRRYGASLRASYFWTQVNRPITALTLSSTPTSTLLQRENLGQIESRGLSLDYAMRPASWLGIEGGYQWADATVTKFAPEPQLVGNWIPQVARNMATSQVRFTRPRLGALSLQGRISGRQFDDDANTFLLHSYFRLDSGAEHNFGRHVVAFASGENLFDRSIEVGKTPLTTLGTPRLARFGLRLNFGD